MRGNAPAGMLMWSAGVGRVDRGWAGVLQGGVRQFALLRVVARLLFSECSGFLVFHLLVESQQASGPSSAVLWCC